MLAFAGYPVGEIEVIGHEQHFAEKLHALTKTYGDRPNSRVRDLADLVFLMEEGFGDLPSLGHAVEVVFADRSTHPVPIEIPDPPEAWRKTYENIASVLEIEPKTLDDAIRAVRDFWRKVLASV